MNKSIPLSLQTTSSGFQKLAGSQISSHVIHMHLALLLCQLLLHWEFLPFLPVRHSQPQGTRDTTDTEAQSRDTPAGFWRSSARECFAAAHSMLQVCNMWKTAGALPLTPFIAYATHTAAFISLYGASFPWMCSHVSNPLQSVMDADAENHMWSKLETEHLKRLECSGFQDLQLSVQLMDGWARTLASIWEYFCRFKTDFRRAGSRYCSSAEMQRSNSLRNGGIGTGALEYASFERALRDFGCLESDRGL